MTGIILSGIALFLASAALTLVVLHIRNGGAS
jgi:hypothetical protein